MRICARFTVVILLALPLYPQNREQTVRIGLPGAWTLNSHPLKKGDRYSALADFQGTKDAGDLLIECGTEGTFAYTCSEERCSVPACTASAKGVMVHVIHHPDVTASPTSSLLGMLTSLLQHDPTPVSVLGVRGVGDPNDAILLKDGNAVHWGPALKGVSEGEYCLQLRSLPQISSSTILILKLVWDRSGDPEGIAPSPNVVPGLYLLAKGTSGPEGNCTLNSEQSPAWVLIAERPKFSRLTKTWKDYAPELKELYKSGASVTLRSTIRHAALAYLSDSQ